MPCLEWIQIKLKPGATDDISSGFSVFKTSAYLLLYLISSNYIICLNVSCFDFSISFFLWLELGSATLRVSINYSRALQCPTHFPTKTQSAPTNRRVKLLFVAQNFIVVGSFSLRFVLLFWTKQYSISIWIFVWLLFWQLNVKVVGVATRLSNYDRVGGKKAANYNIICAIMSLDKIYIVAHCYRVSTGNGLGRGPGT